MKLLITADVHLSHSPDHEYRWKAMENLATIAGNDEDIVGVVIAGDLVDAKDRHPAQFVNRVVEAVKNLTQGATSVYIVKGNHDFLEETCPFFRFLREIDRVVYISEPEAVHICWEKVLFIPYVKNWESNPDWKKRLSLEGNNVIICHQTFAGSVASNGHKLPGVSLATVSSKATGGAQVLSGDIHVPQKIGNVTYVGSPHHVHFGDCFAPSFGLWDLATRTFSRIKRTSIRRLVVDAKYVKGELELTSYRQPREGDHVKLRFYGTRSELVKWPEVKQLYAKEAETVGFTLFGKEFVLVKDRPRRVMLETPITAKDESDAFWEEVPDSFIKAGKKIVQEIV